MDLVEQTDTGPVVIQPHPFFAEAAAGVGSAELPSSYESFRDGSLAVRSGSELYPSFALSLYAHARGVDAQSVLTEARAEELTCPDCPTMSAISLPTGLPNRAGPAQCCRFESALSVLRPERPPMTSRERSRPRLQERSLE